MNIRKRLVVWHTIILASLLLILTVGLYGALNYHLYAEVDDSLSSWAANVIESLDKGDQMIEIGGQINSHPNFPKLNLLESFILVLKNQGEMETDQSISKQSLAKLKHLIKTSVINSNKVYKTIGLDKQLFRIYLKTIPNKTGHNDTLVIGRALMHVQRTLNELTMTLIFAWFIAVLICSVISWFFVGGTLHPVNMMTKDALRIAASGELGRRINEFGENDEFGELSKALNSMLASLEASYISQKKFLADASHELRNPLTSIRGNLEFMKRATDAPQDERLAALGDAMAEVNRMAGLVNDLLMLARAGAPVSFLFEKIDLAEIIKEVIASYQIREQEYHRKFILEKSGPVLVKGDREKLRQVIVILIDNALKYSPVGSNIDLKLTPTDQMIQFEFTDQGPGIPESEIHLVFDRFYRASNVRNNYAGSGLGLSIVKSILDHHNGRIKLENIKPQGLKATIFLPTIKE